ncbi:MAG: AsmA-like C-terminal region-containing protein [Mariprofundaceae bacterium]|nr:AsmA-like C-terminal region-containing protein [Mariprofundaceae bacterium]
MNAIAWKNIALAIGRRVFFALLAGATLAAVAGWLFAPDLKTARPEIEAFLKQELELKELNLGELSWYWAGSLGLKADASSLVNRDASVVVHDCRVTVLISTMELLSGRLTPSGIRFSGGTINVAVDADSQADHPGIPALVTLDDTELRWRYGEYSGHLEHFTLLLDRDEKLLRVRIPGANMSVRMGNQRLPKRVDVSFSNLDWLPEVWRSRFDGAMAGEASLKQKSSTRWSLDFALTSGEAAPVAFSILDTGWKFDSLKGKSVLESGAGEELFEQAVFEPLELRSGESLIRARAEWKAGTFKLSATSPHVDMPLIWNGLRPLDDNEAWHAWLASMQGGVASDARAELAFAWAAPWQAVPTGSEWDSLKYHVIAHVQDADISLGFDQDMAIHTEADVELDQAGLKAIVASTELPHAIGLAKGALSIAWDSLLLEISGTAEADAGRLHAWLDASEAAQITWAAAKAATEFSIKWMPEEELPRSAILHLKPLDTWSLEVKDIPFEVSSGEVVWQLDEGIRFNELLWATPYLSGKSNLAAERGESGVWEIVSMDGRAEGPLSRLAGHFHLPIESAAGTLRASLKFDGSWDGDIDLKQASWSNLLGTEKAAGDPLNITYQGKSIEKQGVPTFLMEKLTCRDQLLRLRGDGELSDSGLRLNLKRLESASFSGGAEIFVPFGSDPWELNVNADYLNRNALPATLPRSTELHQKSWVLRAELKEFLWDDTHIEGAVIRLASALNSTGVLKAKVLQTGALALHDVAAVFAMPGEGKIDLRSFEAGLDDLRLKLSATLTPGNPSGMLWRGFAELKGNFGNMMKRAELSRLFENGDMNILFSGQGEFLREQPWWQGLDGRLRLRVNNGRILKGGTLSKFLAAISIADLPGLFFGGREDLTRPGLGYKRLQMEAVLHGKDVKIHQLAMRSSAMDVAGQGSMDMERTVVDLILVVRPFQNLDALLSRLPLLRDMFGGTAHSFIRRAYRMYGPVADAEVTQISTVEAGLPDPGMIEQLLNLPERWFGKGDPATKQ